jgi:hypothetical protein
MVSARLVVFGIHTLQLHGRSVFLVYVEDIILLGLDESDLNDLIALLQTKFNVKV